MREKQKEKAPPPFSSFSTAVATIRQKEFLISGERKQQGRRGEGFQPGYARTTSNKILPRLNAPLNFAFRLPFRSTPTESSHYRQHPAFSSLFPLLFSSKEASLVRRVRYESKKPGDDYLLRTAKLFSLIFEFRSEKLLRLRRRKINPIKNGLEHALPAQFSSRSRFYKLRNIHSAPEPRTR